MSAPGIDSEVGCGIAERSSCRVCACTHRNTFEAETNLKMVADAIAAIQEEQFDEQFQIASQLEQVGEWDESILVLTSVLEQLSEADDRRKYAENCIAALKQKQKSLDSPPCDQPGV